MAGIELEKIFPNDFEYLHLQLDDSPDQNILQYFDQTYDFINKDNGKTLVHCLMGISRSPTIVIAYLMKSKKLKFHEAKKFVLDLKNWIEPNEGFIDQLLEYEKILTGSVSSNLNYSQPL